jgi:hypothetical protein
MILIRVILIGLALILIARSLVSTGENKKDNPVQKPENNKKVSKKIGDYVDFEEIKGKE